MPWKLYRWTPGGNRKFLEMIDEPADVWGDDLYAHLDPYLQTLPGRPTVDDFEYEGDNEAVDVWGKEESLGGFSFEFVQE